MGILGEQWFAATGAYEIDNSCVLDSASSAYFNRTPGSAGNRRTWTWSGWVKRGVLGSKYFLEII